MLRTLRPYQLAVDLIGAVLFLLIALASSPSTGGWTDPVVALVMSTALAFRRLSPGWALATAWIGAIFQMAVSATAPSFSDFAVLAVLFCTASYGGRVIRWLGLVSAVVGAGIATLYLIVLPLLVHPGRLNQLPRLQAGGVDVARSILITLSGSLAVLGLSWTLGLLARTFRRARESRRAQSRAEQDVVVEQERNRIARDMHDVVAHSLAVVIAQADGARYARAADPEAVDLALTTISTTAREALGDVRILLSQLRHSQGETPQPVLADLDRLFAQLRNSGLTISRLERGHPLSLGTGQQLAVFRIVQEALTNVLRHGDTTAAVEVLFEWENSSLRLSISSAMRGDDSVEPNSGGHGLAGMRERAILAGGSFSADTVDGHYIVSAVLPAPAVTEKAIT